MLMLFIEWMGTILAVAGALLVSSNIKASPWGWWLFMMSSLLLTIFSVIAGHYGLSVMNICFFMINLNGIYRWWYPYYRDNIKSRTAMPLTEG